MERTRLKNLYADYQLTVTIPAAIVLFPCLIMPSITWQTDSPGWNIFTFPSN